jgi:hypothetical protein
LEHASAKGSALSWVAVLGEGRARARASESA